MIHKWWQERSQKKLYFKISSFQCVPGRRLLPLHFPQSQTLETNCLWTRILPNCWALSELQRTPTKILPSLYLENWISRIFYHWSNDPATLLMASHCFLQRFIYSFNFNRSGPLSTALVKKLNKNSKNYRSDLIHKITHSNPTPFQSYTLSILHFSNPTHQHTNTPTHQHTNTPTHQHTNTPTHQHTNTSTHQHTNSPTHMGP